MAEICTKFGWQGITAELPVEWELSGLSGDYSNGAVRLDDQEIPRFELKWSKAKKKPDLQKVLDEYFKALRKQYQKQGTILAIKRDVELVKDATFSEGRDVLCFRWKGDIRANGATWYCHECRRIVIAQILGHPKENLLPLTQQILLSIIDHPQGYTQSWNVYKLGVEIPRRYRLDKNKLMSGYLLLSFVGGSRKIAVERYGLADVLLKETDLEQWFRQTYAKEVAGYGFTMTKHELEDGEKLLLVGYRTRWIDRIPLPPVLLVDKVLRRTGFGAQLWHCRHSNRIFVVRAISLRDAEKTAAEVAASIQCH